ncbi:MAG: cobaltochelatase [crAssphage sp. isolate ctbg_1]|uniref:Cobaltochelatase n=1 Tax=crAssphage sp. isolate ctbg_1 TaxID=2989854 RepID=A0A345MT23_9CAUD|nr:MAG: cobaltochelatase [crAssphage sp. isolate ctbg_1]AXH74523.1 MAG: cobaltochelatase [crAssphage sp. isolate ctbg_1]
MTIIYGVEIAQYVIEEWIDNEKYEHICRDIESANKFYNWLLEDSDRYCDKHYQIILYNSQTRAKLREFDNATDSIKSLQFKD